MSIVLILFGIILLVLGIIQIKNPSFGWQWSRESWKADGDSEPSDSYLIFAEIGGIFGTVAGGVMILIGILKLVL